MYLATAEDGLECKQSLISPRISTEVKVPQEPDLTSICKIKRTKCNQLWTLHMNPLKYLHLTQMLEDNNKPCSR